MPIDYAKYPKNWWDLSLHIRTVRAQGQCECSGECGLHQTHPGPRRCVERNGEKARWANGHIVLTVAHLCHNTACADPEHLRAMCQRCHLRYDSVLHSRHAAETRRRKREEEGQLSLLQRGSA